MKMPRTILLRTGSFLSLYLGLALGLAPTPLRAQLNVPSQAVTVLSDSFAGSSGNLNGRAPEFSAIPGAQWVTDTTFNLDGAGAVTAVMGANKTASIDLGAGYFNSPGYYTLSVDVQFAPGTSASGKVGVAFMNTLAFKGANNMTSYLNDLASTNQGATGSVGSLYGGVDIGYLTGTTLGGTDSPFTLTVVLVRTNGNFWLMTTSITNKTTGQTFYHNGKPYPRPVTVEPNIQYVGIQTGSGSANVPTFDNFKLTYSPVVEPAFYYLKNDQSAGSDWTTVAHWNTKPDGTGTDATALGTMHDVFNNGKVLRTPASGTSQTFAANSLTMTGGGLELRQTSTGAVMGIGKFVSQGCTITNAAGNFAAQLNVTNMAVRNTGVETALSPSASAKTLALTAETLAGAGTLSIQGGGVVQLGIADALDYTGKIVKTSGTSLHFTAPFESNASLVVSTPAEVNLNGNTVTVTSLTVASSAKAVGSHSAGSLGFSGTGTVLVVAPPSDSAAIPSLLGVNLSGPESTPNVVPGTLGSTYTFPTNAELDYYKGKGIKLIRLPFMWERVQRTGVGGALSTADMTAIKNVLVQAGTRGIKVILDMHNYNNRKVGSTNYRIGETTTVTAAHYGDVWQRIINDVKTNTAAYDAVYGYDIMNEPLGSNTVPGLWASNAQAAVTAIRAVDTVKFVIVEGQGNASAENWGNNSIDVVTDSANKIIYSAHTYWDTDNPAHAAQDGTYSYSYERQGTYPDYGVVRAKPFVDWCKARNARGFVGEYGVPTDPAFSGDLRWVNVMFRYLQYLELNGISGTYWSGGPWWGNSYPLACEPNPLTNPDKPVMTALKSFGTPVVYETEDVVTATAVPNIVSVLVEGPLNNTRGEGFSAAQVGDFITYTLPNVPKGNYDILVRVKKFSARGKFELFLDGSATRQGLEQDLYNPATAYAELNVGSVNFTTTANRTFQFKVSGKNPLSSAYTLVFDYIKLQPK